MTPNPGVGEKSLELLEFPRLRSLLTDLATSFPGRRRTESLLPFPSLGEAVDTLHLVDGIRTLFESGRALPAVEAGNLAPVFHRLDHEGAVLDAPEFLRLWPLLTSLGAMKRALAAAESSHPDVFALGIPLRPLPHLERSLERTFEPSGEIRDSASPELAAIRRERERLRERLRARLERMAAAVAGPDGDSVVTLREGRYVLSVPGHRRSEVKGLVQDRSASGATFYVEPFDLVDDNNGLREKDGEEREEILRILGELTRAFARERASLEEGWDRLGLLDALRARALLARRWGGELPELVEERELLLRGARHPLLLESRGVAVDPARARGEVVPLDIALDASTRFLLITGPNMGGKTVALKCVGLVTLMAASGCLVPADPGCRIPWITTWVVDLGDEQSLDRDLSTFGAHVKRWAEALERTGPGTLVLLDELGSGTDPLEGAALGQSILERLLDGGGLGLVTTHAGALKGFASGREGIKNASMVFDADGRRPTFRIAVGTPGESHALDMARRLGFPADVVDRAEALLPEGERDLRRLLAELETERAGLRSRAADLDRRVADAERLQAEARERLHRFLEERAELRARAARQAREILRRAEDGLRETRRTEKREAKSRVETRRVLAREQARLARLETVPVPRAPGIRPTLVRPGERYWADGLAREVEIVRGADDGGRVLVQHGGLRVELPIESLRILREGGLPGDGPGGDAGGGARRTDSVALLTDPETAAHEVDLRGLRADEAIARLDLAVDRALLAGLRQLRIIHGIGTGALRKAVVAYCRNHGAVKSSRLGEKHEGGDGATVIELEG